MNSHEQLEAKMTEEFNTYRAWLLQQPPEEILKHAYEYSVKQDIILNVADADLSPAQIETMLRSPCPLEDVFKEASYSDMSDYNSFLSFCLAERADAEIAKQRAVPIYDGTAREAKEQGELDKFKASRRADSDCRDAIENAIVRNYDGSRLNTKAAIAEVREQFGEKRLTRVTASLIANRPHDARISPENRAWADKKAISKEIGSGHTHPGLLDIFASRLREGERKRERGAER